MAGSPEDSGGLKRKRVARACETCRSFKSKCDAKQPMCTRCIDYGYVCIYSPRKRRFPPTENGLGASVRSGPEGIAELRDAVRRYEALLDEVVPHIPSSTRDSTAATRASIQAQVDHALSGIGPAIITAVKSQGGPDDTAAPPCTPRQSQRYLGEVSDVRFFHLVKVLLRTENPPDGSGQGLDSYEQDSQIPPAHVFDSPAIELPSPEKEQQLIDVYFSTIHLAYPFVPQSVFMANYSKMRTARDDLEPVDTTWLALLHTICAIGAYYTTFLGEDSGIGKLHEIYFIRASSKTLLPTSADRSMGQVSLLLAQCFYFLAVCQTDSCWTALGLAVRTAQSIGLHVENDGRITSPPVSRIEIEKRRRLWYSIYVLDRLLALQLGRPPAIHDEDCRVPLPSRAADADIDWDGDNVAEAQDGPSGGDYFLTMIAFSTIVGRVLRELSSPEQSYATPEGLVRTQVLDKLLLNWKLGLPRTLRFDLAHAFEKSVTFKRQRNMLAVKFYHLRAVIHRPYLRYLLLRQPDGDAPTPLLQTDWNLVGTYEKNCVTAARETAHLLHHVSGQKDLVHDFPWWQMISCLIYASSILLVSSIFIRPNDDAVAEADSAALYDDAETCLTVFEALSANSTGARIARDMMKSLKEYGQKWRTQIRLADTFHKGVHTDTLSGEAADPDIQDAQLFGDLLSTSQNWPSEIEDSMNWSAQFLGAIQTSSP
ncbi:hypothetical protein GQ53DRAFT_701463, partial [Thozetella sp. PMI_491]